VIGRRQIEMYSRLIHTVDHIEGRLRDGMDAFDGFLSHAWAVTVTGAPKLWAMRFHRKQREEPARLVWRRDRHGEVQRRHEHRPDAAHHPCIKRRHRLGRAGATLLFDSVPEDEEAETELKASAMLAAIRDAGWAMPVRNRETAKVGEGVKILLVDHEDSFVHTLANYFRQTGAKVRTVRSPVPKRCSTTTSRTRGAVAGTGHARRISIARRRSSKARARDLPIFGVCLGLQALTESYGGNLRELACRCMASRRASGYRPNKVFLRPAEGGDGRALSFDLSPITRHCRRNSVSRRRPMTGW
jgi:anthranilate synthase